MKHTPGPWEAVVSIHGNGGKVKKWVIRNAVYDAPNPFDYGVLTTTKEADAFLIAAAPDILAEAHSDTVLFEFLETELNICIDNFQGWQPKDVKAFLADLRHAIGKRDMATRAAIAKATGGQP